MKLKTSLAIAAAALAVTAAAATILPHMMHGHNGHGGHDTMASGSMDHGPGDHVMQVHGDLMLKNAFAFATLPNQPVGGGFVSVENTGLVDDRLIAVSTDIAGKSEIHTMIMDDGVMIMRELDTGLDIPAGTTVEMKPGGYHLMFMQLTEGLVDGEELAVTLTFENAGPVDMTLPIRKRMGGSHANHGDH